MMAILLQSTVPVARDIAQMSQATADQSMLIYVLIAGYGALVSAIGLIWRKWEASREENKQAARDREALILEHNREKQAVLLENNKISQQLGRLLAKLDDK